LSDLNSENIIRIYDCIFGGYLNTGLANHNVMNSYKMIIDATVTFFFKIKSELLPTPSRPLYTFNARDVAKVIQGIMQVNYWINKF